MTGKCGHSCEGSPADTLGIIEWDTKSKQIIGYHLNSLGYAADPYIDPSGKYLIMLANDGGREATILRTGKNGEASQELTAITTGFSEEDGEKGIWDVCFIENEDMDIAIFVSTLANFVVLADMRPLEENNPITTQKIWLTDDQEAEVTSNHGRGARRNCAWAFGSPYVWVDAGKTEEVHILELHMQENGEPTATRIRNVLNTPSRFMAWVSNHKKDEILAEALAASIAAQPRPSLQVPTPSKTTTTTVEAQTFTDTTEDVDVTTSNVAIAALVFGLLAYFLSLVLAIQFYKIKTQVEGSAWANKKGAEESPMEQNELE